MPFRQNPTQKPFGRPSILKSAFSGGNFSGSFVTLDLYDVQFWFSGGVTSLVLTTPQLYHLGPSGLGWLLTRKPRFLLSSIRSFRTIVVYVNHPLPPSRAFPSVTLAFILPSPFSLNISAASAALRSSILIRWTSMTSVPSAARVRRISTLPTLTAVTTVPSRN